MRISASVGALGVGGRRAVVGAQQALVGGLVEVVVDGQVAEVEARVAHARVLPVDDQQPVAIVRADDVAREQVVVAGTRAPQRQRGGDACGHGCGVPVVGAAGVTPRACI